MLPLRTTNRTARSHPRWIRLGACGLALAGALAASASTSAAWGHAGRPADRPGAAGEERALVAPRPAAELLADARLAPPDTTLLLHVDGAAALRRRLAGRALEDVVLDLLGGAATRDAWRSLAFAARRDGPALFDELLGRSLTLAVRPGADGGGLPDWALRATIDDDARRDLLDALRPLRARPRAGLATGRLPEQRLELVLVPGGLLVGPEGGRLLGDVARRAAAPAADLPSLADHEAIVRGARLGAGHAAVMLRHAAPTGGSSVLVAGLEGDRLRIRHAGRYEDPPFTRPLPDRDWNAGPLEAFADGFALALAEPTSIDGGPSLAWLEALLDLPLLGRDMRRHVAERRLVVIGRPADGAVMPPVAIAIEHERTDGAEAALDVHARRLAGAIADLLAEHAEPGAASGGTVDPMDPLGGLGSVPKVLDLGARGVDAGATIRVAELRPFVRPGSLAAALGGARGLELAWTTAAGPAGRWYVVASDRDHAGAVAERLADAADALADDAAGRWSSCGLFDARGLARGLATLRDGAAGAVAGGDPGQAALLQQAVERLVGLLDTVDHGRWRLVRPDVDSVELAIDLELRPPRSGDR